MPTPVSFIFSVLKLKKEHLIKGLFFFRIVTGIKVHVFGRQTMFDMVKVKAAIKLDHVTVKDAELVWLRVEY